MMTNRGLSSSRNGSDDSGGFLSELGQIGGESSGLVFSTAAATTFEATALAAVVMEDVGGAEPGAGGSGGDSARKAAGLLVGQQKFHR
jgi:hypothetical protein